MQFSLALIALVAGSALAMPVWESANVGKPSHNQPPPATTTAWGQWNSKTTPPPHGQSPPPSGKGKGPGPKGPTPAGGKSAPSPPPGTPPSGSPPSGSPPTGTPPAGSPPAKPTGNGGSTKKVTTWSNVVSTSETSFSAPGQDLKNKMGSPPSDTCSWEFILSCGQQVYQHADSCMKVMAKGSDNCFKDTTCAAAIGSNAPTCATCYNSLGKQKFVTACYNEKSNENVKPIFNAMVSYGVCNSNGVVTSSSSSSSSKGWSNMS